MRMKKLINVSLTVRFCLTLIVCHAHWHARQHQSTSTAVCSKTASLDGAPAVTQAPPLCLYSASPGILGSGLPPGVQWSAILETVSF